jgi:predicted transcriptional regulator
MPRKTLLLSIRPEFADKIFEGTKRAELRRTRPKVERGDRVYVYVASPVKALRGTFRVNKVIGDLPRKLWRKVKHMAGVTRKQFDEYYEGAEMAYAILLESVRDFVKAIQLKCLRQKWPGFRPPQSYIYITDSRLTSLGSVKTS